MNCSKSFDYNRKLFLFGELLCLFTLAILMSPNYLYGGVSARRNQVVAAVEMVENTVVSLSTERLIVKRHMDPLFGFRSEIFNDFFNDFFDSFEEKKVETPLGSGVIIDKDGYIVTNEHVISRASKITVMLADQTELVATLIRSDPVNDLALLKVDTAEPLPFIKLGTSKDLMIGETVIALGNPFGLGHSVTTGVLSALHRTLNVGNDKLNIEYKDLIQTDALINPGNSGGPLVNVDGELIGINTAILTKAQGIGFAIPVDKVRRILVKLLNFREINKVWLGAGVEDYTDPLLKGVKIVKIEEDSPVDNAGLHEGDIITKIDGEEIRDVLDYEKHILKKEVNDIIRVYINRDSTEKVISVKLDRTPKPSAEKLAKDKLGLYIQELTYSIANRLGIKSTKRGILISGIEENSPAAEVSIKPGYVIVRINKYRITSFEDLGIILSKVYSEDIIDIGLIWADAYGEHRGYGRLKVR